MSTSHAERYVVIMAGGSGTRLWPLSRKSMPKQFLSLIGTGTLLQQMFERVTMVVPADHVFLMADKERAAIAQEQLKDIPAENIIIEPSGRDTGPAMALASLLLEQRHPGCQVAVVWSDHSIEFPETFKNVLTAAFETLDEQPKMVVSVGVKPDRPATEFGYIRLGQQLKTKTSEPVFRVESFVEKPDLATATKYVADWRYLWNTGYKVYVAQHLLDLLAEHQPEFHTTLMAIGQQLEDNPRADVSQLWEQLERKDIERLVTEKIKDILVIPADLGWSDVGSWDTLHSILSEQLGTDLVAKTEHVDVGSRNCLVIAKDKMVATAGLENIIIIDTPDALLVIDKSHAQAVKELVNQLKELKADHLL